MRAPGLSAVVLLAAVSTSVPVDEQPTEQDVVTGAVNAAYQVSGDRVKLRSGMLRRPPASPRATRMVTTSMWGAPALGDLNGDGRQDAALILLHEPGGARELYYAVACVSRRYHKMCKGTQAVFLGDRISPQRITIRDRTIVIEYASHAPGEPAGSPPSVGVTRRLGVYRGELGRRP